MMPMIRNLRVQEEFDMEGLLEALIKTRGRSSASPPLASAHPSYSAVWRNRLPSRIRMQARIKLDSTSVSTRDWLLT